MVIPPMTDNFLHRSTPSDRHYKAIPTNIRCFDDISTFVFKVRNIHQLPWQIIGRGGSRFRVDLYNCTSSYSVFWWFWCKSTKLFRVCNDYHLLWNLPLHIFVKLIYNSTFLHSVFWRFFPHLLPELFQIRYFEFTVGTASYDRKIHIFV